MGQGNIDGGAERSMRKRQTALMFYSGSHWAATGDANTISSLRIRPTLSENTDMRRKKTLIEEAGRSDKLDANPRRWINYVRLSDALIR